jgi:diguanylate cyclase (GGDEF)-like protein/PAS domain S-box-containing protein
MQFIVQSAHKTGPARSWWHARRTRLHAACRAISRWLRGAVGLSTAIALVCLGLSAAIWTAVITQEEHERQEAIAAAIRQDSNLAIAFEEYVVRTIRGIDAVALFLKREYTEHGARIGITQSIKAAGIEDQLFTSINIADERGDIVAGGSARQGINVADREHFMVHVAGDTGKLFVAKPVLSRTTGKWTILMTRRLNKPDGRFGGIVAIGVDPDYFNGFYQKAEPNAGSLIALIGLDGVVRSQLLGRETSFGQDMRDSALMRERAKNPSADVLTSGMVEGIPYYASYRSLRDYPLMVVAGNSQAEVLAAPARRERNYFWAAAAFSLVIVFFAALLITALGRQRRSLAALAASEARFRALTQLSSDWHWEHDENQVFTSMSEHVLEKSGISAGAVLGKTRWELAMRYAPEDRAVLEADLAARRPFRDFEFSRVDENGQLRYAQVSGEPMFDGDGDYIGYRGIGKDITERKQREEDLRRFRAAMDATSDAIFLTDRHSLRYVDVNAAACEMLGYTAEELLALGPESVLSIQRDELVRGFDAVIGNEGSTETFESLLTRKDGSQVWCELRRRAQRSGEGWIIVSVVRDITLRREDEQAFLHQTMQQSLIAEFGKQALLSADLGELLGNALELASDGLYAEFCRVLQLTPDGQALIVRAGSGWEEHAGEPNAAESDSLAQYRHAVAASEPVVIDDLAKETRFVPSAILKAHGIRSGVEVPIVGTSGTFGVFGVYSQEPMQFAAESVNFLKSVANIVAIAIDRKSVEDKLAHLAQFDTLTGLPNRDLFRDRLGQSLTLARRNDWLSGVMFIDLDRFKAVNDTYGHAIGDKLLQKVALRLKECVRAGDTVGRLGGDEFAIVLSKLVKDDDAALVAKKVIAALVRPFILEGNETYMSASLGIALYPGDGKDSDILLKNADTAMYRAKEQGRNTYRFYLPQMNERALERLQVETQLRGALERAEFRLHYQPKVNLASGKISGFEALLRWQHPERGLVPPIEFISILEELGAIVQVGEWVVRTVCEQIRLWREQGVPPMPVAINLSARQFQQKNLDAVIGGILSETGVDPSLLEFELTESLLMNDAEEAARTLNNMKAYGVRLSVDDFGTGYSSLAYLKRFPLDTLKIDRAFVRDVTVNPDDAAIAIAIINLAHSLQLNVVAEGVETAPQLNFLRERGCDEMQGFYFAQPLPAADCTLALLEDRRLPQASTGEADSLTSVLLIDDDDEDIDMLQTLFRSAGYLVICASGSKQGFEILANRPVDIVICDQGLPGMTGVEFLSAVRAMYPEVVRILISGMASILSITGGINEAGIHKYLSKDWSDVKKKEAVREAYSRNGLVSAERRAAMPRPAADAVSDITLPQKS